MGLLLDALWLRESCHVRLVPGVRGKWQGMLSADTVCSRRVRQKLKWAEASTSRLSPKPVRTAPVRPGGGLSLGLSSVNMGPAHTPLAEHRAARLARGRRARPPRPALAGPGGPRVCAARHLPLSPTHSALQELQGQRRRAELRVRRGPRWQCTPGRCSAAGLGAPAEGRPRRGSKELSVLDVLGVGWGTLPTPGAFYPSESGSGSDHPFSNTALRSPVSQIHSFILYGTFSRPLTSLPQKGLCLPGETSLALAHPLQPRAPRRCSPALRSP